jgi:site-specific recombinase XerD
VGIYRDNLGRFARETGAATLEDVSSLRVQRYLTGLQGRMKPVSVHQHYRCLRAFFGWCVGAGLLATNPTQGLAMRLPKSLPRVPDDEAVPRLLAACPDTFEGRRARTLIALLADSGLRVSEALRLQIEDVRLSTRTLVVRGGKGAKDRTGYFGAAAAHELRAWVQARPGAYPEDFLFTDRQGRPLGRVHVCHVLHRLSVRAELPHKIGPHALRNYAATSILKQTGDLELVRQVLGHESLTMTLRYARLAQPDVSRKFRRASPLDNLRVGR